MNIILLDAETTGIEIYKDRPVQLSMVLVANNERRVLMNTLCDPGMPIPKGASAVHGITDEQVIGRPDSAVACWQAEHIASLASPDVLVTYNGKLFDIPMITRLSGGSFLNSLPHIDVLDMAYRYVPSLPDHKLGTLYKHLVGEAATNAHDALADVMYTYDILESLRKRAGLSLVDLLEDMSTPKPYQIMPIGKHKGKLLGDVPTGFARWLLNENAGKPMRADLRVSMEAVLNGTA